MTLVEGWTVPAGFHCCDWRHGKTDLTRHAGRRIERLVALSRRGAVTVVAPHTSVCLVSRSDIWNVGWVTSGEGDGLDLVEAKRLDVPHDSLGWKRAVEGMSCTEPGVVAGSRIVLSLSASLAIGEAYVRRIRSSSRRRARTTSGSSSLIVSLSGPRSWSLL
jgi:hypothetical protein